eukprot:CAMPEP_0181308862 /NCGR_PEP_ID=MMETSP1101-20121128/11704_1 /TAXON_ID=46948 /ORGANISM="Rhodomonas abbreviata, Strain Caron Lab Isolate" /LENGTH=152 /DNA_ID=CAMNT_0023415303 /DNA_START=357 /DNA_END=814 /DNA_ORIENTATION=+
MKSRISKRGFQSTSTPYAEGALQHRSSNLGIWRSSRASPPCQLNAIASFISTSSRSSLLASTTLASPEQTADASSSLSFTSSSMATRRSRAAQYSLLEPLIDVLRAADPDVGVAPPRTLLADPALIAPFRLLLDTAAKISEHLEAKTQPQAQ